MYLPEAAPEWSRVTKCYLHNVFFFWISGIWMKYETQAKYYVDET